MVLWPGASKREQKHADLENGPDGEAWIKQKARYALQEQARLAAEAKRKAAEDEARKKRGAADDERNRGARGYSAFRRYNSRWP